MKIRRRDILYSALSSLLMVILLFHPSFGIRGRLDLTLLCDVTWIAPWRYAGVCCAEGAPVWSSIGEWWRLFVSHGSRMDLCEWRSCWHLFIHRSLWAAPWMQSVCWSCLLCSPCWSYLSCSLWGSCSIWARLFDGVTTKLAMCPQKLVHRDGDVSGTKDRNGIDPRDMLKFEPCPIGGSSSTLQLWSHSCTGWNKNFQWPSILPLPHVIRVKW